MKNSAFLVFLVLSFRISAQQIFFPFAYEPTAHYWVSDSINCEDQSSFEIVISDSLWQLGVPQKVFFNQAWTEPNALLTDTISPYPANADASFYLKLNPNSMFNVFVSFNHKADLGQGDSCIVELSDDGNNWFGLNDFYDHFITWGTITVGETDLTTNISDLQYYFNQPEGLFYTDTNFVWMQTSFWFEWIFPVKENDLLFTDSLFVRFRFVSDNNDQNQEGWMIDNLYIGEFVTGSGINDNNGSFNISVSPNPSGEIITFNAEQFSYPLRISVYDLGGKILQTETVYTDALKVNNLANGQYFIHFRDAIGKMAYSKLQILR